MNIAFRSSLSFSTKYTFMYHRSSRTVGVNVCTTTELIPVVGRFPVVFRASLEHQFGNVARIDIANRQ